MWTMKRQRRDEVDETVVAAEVVTVRVLQARHPDQALPIFAAPGRCLRCDDMALVERVDPAAGRAHHRCHACGATWTMSRAALRRAATEDQDRALVIAGGTLVEPLVEAEAVAIEADAAVDAIQLVDQAEAAPSTVVTPAPSVVTPPPPVRSLRVGAAPRVRFVV